MNFAGRDWWYDYRELFELCNEKSLSKTISKALKQYSRLTKSWNEETNSEWVCRFYLATKMILNATVLTNAVEHANDTGQTIANPYYEYYAVLSLLRAVVYTMPSQNWENGKLITISHSSSINLAFDCLSQIDQETSKRLLTLTKQLKAQREVISYRAPASGNAVLDENYDLNECLTVLAELAQFNSELLEQSISKNASSASFVVVDKYLQQLSTYTIDEFVFYDKEDAKRLNYLRRKVKRPFNLRSVMTEGQTEDFFGARDSADASFSKGAPTDWQRFFDIP